MYDSDDSYWDGDLNEEDEEDNYDVDNNENDQRRGARDPYSFETIFARRQDVLLQSRGEIIVGRNLRSGNNPLPANNSPMDIIPPSNNNNNDNNNNQQSVVGNRPHNVGHTALF